MARAILLGLFTAVRAVLIYGEWSDLSARPVRLPRLGLSRRRGERPARAPQADGLVAAVAARHARH